MQEAESDVVAKVIAARHDLHARRRADRLRIRMLEADPARGQSIEVGCLVVFRTVGADTLESHVIGHDQNDVWLVRRGRRSRAYKKEQCREEKPHLLVPELDVNWNTNPHLSSLIRNAL